MQFFIFLILAPLTALILVITIVMVARRPRSGQSFPIMGALWVSLGYVVTNTLELAWPTATGTMIFAKLGYFFSTPVPRDDSGLWHQVENYVSGHSRLQFSHGLCPDCERKHREAHRTPPPPAGGA